MVRHSGQHRQPDNRRPDERTATGREVAWNGWQQPHGRRALRLIAAIGTIVGGLCVVLATMALVVEFGSRSPGPPKPTIGRTLATYSGPGAQPPRPIPIPRAGTYGIAWSFSCRPGQSGAFTVEDRSDPATSKADIAASGTSGKGTWWDRRTRTVRTLYVIADCSWKARVVRPATAGAPTTQAGNDAAHKPKHQHKNRGHVQHGQKMHKQKKYEHKKHKQKKAQ
jgi:hypothetical protein